MCSPASVMLYQSLFVPSDVILLLLSFLSQSLEDELEKLEASIQETTQNFDETVHKLSEKKVKLEMVIYQVLQRTFIFHLCLSAAGMLIYFLLQSFHRKNSK